MQKRFLPKDFSIPTVKWKQKYVIRPLIMEDVTKDFTCYMGCVDYIQEGAFIQPVNRPFTDFPNHNITLRKALILLAVAEYEMALGNRVEYGIFSDDEQEEFGCVYIMPSMKEGHDAQVTFWVKEESYALLDNELYNFLKNWVPYAYPFLKTILFPGREITWEAWSDLPRKETK
ncbi:hypothetical protein [Sneathiella aquimaris]|uniref:hypothetical protein n=1 Tax=Sneathiella aquimaris TaxID=2599305 RepID=UPI00146C522A|nr:hypothetical protein [Sneathiella aquimaris]